MVANWCAFLDVLGNNAPKSRKPGLKVVQFVPVPLPLLSLVDCQITLQVFLALEVLASFARDGSFPKFYNLEVQEWVSQPLFCFVEVRDLFLRRYLFLHPKFLHEAQVELEGAIIDSLRTVRCRS